MSTIKLAMASGVALLFSSILMISSASASLLGTTISGCSDSAYFGTVTADPAECFLQEVGFDGTAEVVDPGYEFDLGDFRHVDFTGDTVSLIYEDGHGSSSPDLFVFTDLLWDGQPGEIVGLELITADPLGITTVFTASSIGLLVSDPLNVATVTFNILTRHSAVPVPAAVWLFGTGVLGLIGYTRRRKTA